MKMILSANEFLELATSEDPIEAKKAAVVEAPEEVWLEIIDRYPDLRFDVAQNKNVPLRVLEVLADDSDSRIRGMVARKRKASSDILHRLSQDLDSGVRLAVAYNKSTPRCILEALRNDSWAEVAAKANERLQDTPTN